MESLPQPFRFTAREYDPDTGLTHYRARTYDPATGRFLQEDPIWFEAGDLNVYRYTWNSPANWTDPSGMSASEYGTTAGMVTRSMTAMARVGNRLSCILFGIAGVLDAVNAAQQQGFTVETVAMYTVEAGAWALECGAKVKAKKLEKSCKLQKPLELLLSRSGIPANLEFMNSFTEGTKVLTKEGYRPIENIEVGDLVAAIDEKTGKRVWRKVVERFSREAPGTLSLTLEDGDGRRETIETTPEHPFHAEGWDGRVETLVATLRGEAPAMSVSPERLFPSAGKTPFGEWIKAGALKEGDKISTPTSVVQAKRDGLALQAANDNAVLTVAEIIRKNRAARVYNFEVESRTGEITNNYFVGDEQAWVHNAETPATRRGRLVHQAWDWGSGFKKEWNIPGAGRADAYNPTTFEVCELKPNNPRAIRLGRKQLAKYIRGLRNDPSIPSRWFKPRLETY